MLVFDLLEHDLNGYSVYVPEANYAAWHAATPNGAPNLSRVQLRIVPLDRPDTAERQVAAMTEFWPAFFDATDVETLDVDPRCERKPLILADSLYLRRCKALRRGG